MGKGASFYFKMRDVFLKGSIMRCLTILIFSLFSPVILLSQKVSQRDFLFDWSPNPTVFLKKNHEKLLSKEELAEVLNCTAIVFDAEVDISSSKILSVKYSSQSAQYNKIDNSPDLSLSTQRKLEAILGEYISITQVRLISQQKISPDTLIFLMSIDLDERDKRKLRKSIKR